MDRAATSLWTGQFRLLVLGFGLQAGLVQTLRCFCSGLSLCAIAAFHGPGAAAQFRWRQGERPLSAGVLFANLVGQVLVGILFSVLFTPRYGLINRGFQMVLHWGLEARWLSEPRLIMPAIVLTSLWLWVGFNMIYFLAALQTVDKTLQEAARIDGASPWQIFWHVTLPSMRHVVIFVVIMSVIGSYQLFELPLTLLSESYGYGANDAGLTLITYLNTTMPSAAATWAWDLRWVGGGHDHLHSFSLVTDQIGTYCGGRLGDEPPASFAAGAWLWPISCSACWGGVGWRPALHADVASAWAPSWYWRPLPGCWPQYFKDRSVLNEFIFLPR